MVFTFMIRDRDSVIKLCMMRYRTVIFLMDFEKIRFKNIFLLDFRIFSVPMMDSLYANKTL